MQRLPVACDMMVISTEPFGLRIW